MKERKSCLGKDALEEQTNMSMHDECMSLLADQSCNSFVGGLLQHSRSEWCMRDKHMHEFAC